MRDEPDVRLAVASHLKSKRRLLRDMRPELAILFATATLMLFVLMYFGAFPGLALAATLYVVGLVLLLLIVRTLLAVRIHSTAADMLFTARADHWLVRNTLAIAQVDAEAAARYWFEHGRGQDLEEAQQQPN